MSTSTVVFPLLLGLALWTWAALVPCSLATFKPRARLTSQISGADGYRRLVAALPGLAGVRVVERNDQAVLLSAMPTPRSIDRGWGLFVVVALAADGDILFMARRKLPFPAGSLDASLAQIERDARQWAVAAA